MSHIRLRLFLTCWLVFVLHFATDFVREHYLVLSIVDEHSFRLDPYVGLHPDIFVTPGRGAHHGANPGASLVAAIPYLIAKPLIDRVAVARMARAPSSTAVGTLYDDHRPARVRFYNEVRARGLDLKFGMVGFVTMAFCMAPLAAASAVTMFGALTHLGLSTVTAIGMAMLYAFGTPVFFRAGYLNQNLMVGIFGFAAFVLLWKQREDSQRRMWPIFAAGALGGLAVLCDYSGVIVLGLLGVYGCLADTNLSGVVKRSIAYVGGAIGPVATLWFYQWKAFGSLFYPPQHFMPPQIYSDTGYQGIAGPSADLLKMLLFDPGFGLFVAAPILLLAVWAPVLSLQGKSRVPLRETLLILSLAGAFILFFSTVEYTRLQWVTGIRYLVPVVPFLFVLVVAVLIRLPRAISYPIACLAVAQTWAMSMARRVGVPGETVFTSIASVFREGLQLPWLTTLGKMGEHYLPFLGGRRVSALPFFLVCLAVIYGIWRGRPSWKPEAT